MRPDMKKALMTMTAAAMILSAASCRMPWQSEQTESTTTAAETTTAAGETTAATETTTAASETQTEAAAETTSDAAASAAETTSPAEAPNGEETTTTAAATAGTTEAVRTAAETTAETTAAKTGLFDNIGVTTTLAQNEGIDARGNKYVDVVFDELPTTYEEFIALPQAELSNVYDTAAMTVLALCFYPSDPELSMKMYEYVSGPRTINNTEYSFIKDRFMDYDYVPRSYFTGATPSNDYKPSEPYTVRVSETPYTYDNEGYAKMYLTSGGADNDRFVTLRKGKDDKWYLWEQFILLGIREPESSNPWA